jgi:predicted phosphate transport protein (TIGR00153 family)
VKRLKLFYKTRELESQIDEFCEKVDQGAMTFKIGINCYINGDFTAFEEKLKQVNQLESQGDTLRRNIERRLYEQTLIPESRGDVLGLLENMDTILNSCEGAMWQFAIEKPHIPQEFHTDYILLVDASVSAVDSLVSASRSFFRGAETVTDFMHKVLFYEKEGDKISTRLKMAIFADGLDLAHKAQLRNFVEHIDDIADTAEDVADRLAIYSIKRSI